MEPNEKELTFLEKFLTYVPNTIDEEGLFPFPGWLITDKDEMTITSLAVGPEEAYLSILSLAVKMNAREFVFGIDRYNKEGQGVDMRFKSVFTAIHFNRGNDMPTIAILPYNSNEDYGQWDYNNVWWKNAIHHELTKIFKKLRFKQQ